MPGRLEFAFSNAPQARPRRQQDPMRILLLGDFSAQAGAERKPLALRATQRVDVDSLDALMQRLAPCLTWAGEPVDFQSQDDFHPDALLARVPVFAQLRNLRQRLLDPARFAQAAAELGSPAATPPAPASAPQPEAGRGDLLAGLLGGRPAGAATQPAQTASQAPTSTAAAAGMDALIRSIVTPHIVPDHGPQQAALVASVDSAIAAQMRQILHDGSFQALESAWRGVQWLIACLELDETLELHLFDVRRDELMADVVASQGRLAETGLHRALADRWRQVPGAQGWSLLVSLDRFGPAEADIGLLAALGLIAAQAGGPLLAGAQPSLVPGAWANTPAAHAATADLSGWQTLRSSEAAPWIGLVAPRVLLRLPYGRRSDPVNTFSFEEWPGGQPEHEQLLWGAGSLAAALLIGRAFSERGWAFEPGDEREVGDLPAYSFDRDGEREMQACAEYYLGEQAAQALLEAGLMPLLSHKHRNAATLQRFQSIADPVRGLAGLDGLGTD